MVRQVFTNRCRCEQRLNATSEERPPWSRRFARTLLLPLLFEDANCACVLKPRYSALDRALELSTLSAATEAAAWYSIVQAFNWEVLNALGLPRFRQTCSCTRRREDTRARQPSPPYSLRFPLSGCMLVKAPRSPPPRNIQVQGALPRCQENAGTIAWQWSCALSHAPAPPRPTLGREAASVDLLHTNVLAIEPFVGS